MASDERFDKIYKSANKKSILHVSPLLNHHVQKGNESVYKGKIVFYITEIDENTQKARKAKINGKMTEKYLKAYVNKSATKHLMHSIINHTFGVDDFKQGFVDYGGTKSKNQGEIRSRVFKISKTERHYVFSISEGRGKSGQTGNIVMMGEPEIIVQKYTSFDEAIEMAIEVLDYIRHSELIALSKGEPLNTFSTVQKPATQSPSEHHQSPPESQEQGEVRHVPYIIQIDPWKGKSLTELSNHNLRDIVMRFKNNKEEHIKNLLREVIKEGNRRVELSKKPPE